MAASRVVVVRSDRVWGPAGEPDRDVLRALLARGFELLTGRRDPAGAVTAVFRPEDRVGVKINTIGGRAISTRPELALGFADHLVSGGVRRENIIIWDRTNRELRDAGYRLEAGQRELKIFGTDSGGVGYDGELVSHRNVGSMFSAIQKNMITASVSLAILKDHGIAGVTAGMKNYFGAVHNPNKYHDSGCDPYVAEVFDCPAVRSKHRLSVLDCLLVQFHKGPAYHPRWAHRFGGLVFSLDPVAADRVGWLIIERLRASAGLPALAAENREPAYLASAEKMGLGIARLDRIELIEESLT